MFSRYLIKHNTKRIANQIYSDYRSQKYENLKGQCHEMNNFFEDLKNQISTFCMALLVFKFFASSMYRKVLFKGAQAWDIRSLGFSWFLHHKVSTFGRLRGQNNKKKFKIFRGSFRGAKFLMRMLSLFSGRFFF
jgi:hypothetical protein